VPGWLERVDQRRRGRAEQRSSIDTWISDYLLPWSNGGLFSYNGSQYPFGLNQTLTGQRVQEITATLPGYMAALRMCPPAFAAQLVRCLALSQARFTFRNLPSSRTPRRTFGNTELGVLERPWTNATTGELLARMEWHAGPAGNSFVHRRSIPPTPAAPLGKRLRVLRPDWTAIAYGSQREPDDPAHALDGEVVGYVYANGGFGVGDPVTLLPEDVAHWAPIPDPEGAGIGMSWITPAVREIMADRAVTEHKLAFFRNGATPNLVVKGIANPDGSKLTVEQFNEIVDMLEQGHAGLANAYRTLYLTAGADATVVGANLAELDLKTVQGASETRLAVLSRVPAPILGVSEGLAGSSLNAGNLGVARRNFADGWIYPTLQDLAASLAPLVNVPSDAELWYDPADMPILREDAKDAAEIEQIKASTIRQLVDGGFKPETVIAAVNGQDMSQLIHTGLVPVQLQPPGGPAGRDPQAQQARDLVEMIQKVYLGVGVVITAEEGREILNQAGANLPPNTQIAPPPNGQIPAGVGAG
jgi:phage portal protein BeeE